MKILFHISLLQIFLVLLTTVVECKRRNILHAEMPVSYQIGPPVCKNEEEQKNFKVNGFKTFEGFCFTKVIRQPCSLDMKDFEICNIELKGCLNMRDIRANVFWAARDNEDSVYIIKLSEW